MQVTKTPITLTEDELNLLIALVKARNSPESWTEEQTTELAALFRKHFGETCKDLKPTVYPDGPVVRTDFHAEEAEFFAILAEDSDHLATTEWTAVRWQHEGPHKFTYYNRFDFAFHVR